MDPVPLETLEDLIRIPPFHRYLGVEVVSAEKGRVVLRIPPREEFVGNPTIPAVHGGIISALIDLAGGAVLFVETRSPTPTIDMRVDFLRPAIAGKPLTAEARVKNLGKTVGFVDVDVTQPLVGLTGRTAEPFGDVTDEEKRLVAQGRCAYFVKERGPSEEEAYPIG